MPGTNRAFSNTGMAHSGRSAHCSNTTFIIHTNRIGQGKGARVDRHIAKFQHG